MPPILLHDIVTGVVLPLLVSLVTTVGIIWIAQPFREYRSARTEAIEALLTYDHLYEAYRQDSNESTEGDLAATELRLRSAALRLQTTYLQVPGRRVLSWIHLMPSRLDWEGVVSTMLEFSYTVRQKHINPWRGDRALCLWILGVDIGRRRARSQRGLTSDRKREVQ
jgi:hypothetical protein